MDERKGENYIPLGINAGSIIKHSEETTIFSLQIFSVVFNLVVIYSHHIRSI